MVLVAECDSYPVSIMAPSLIGQWVTGAGP